MTTSGEQFVMIPGAVVMQLWLADNSASSHMVRDSN